MEKAEIALHLTLAAMDKLPIARGGASPRSTADAVGELYCELLHKVGRAVEDAKGLKQEIAM